jgi:tetratricopeptide (TPR) repeat protein
MPINRVPQTQGMNSDYYFKEAAKKSLAGDLTHGIELLKKGLLLKPNHFLCRFNHGVLMFKFGLIREAAEDFESIIKDHPKTKEYWVYFNHAICLMLLEVPVPDKKAIDLHQMQDPKNRYNQHFDPWWEEINQEAKCNHKDHKKLSPENKQVKSNYQKADENL